MFMQGRLVEICEMSTPSRPPPPRPAPKPGQVKVFRALYRYEALNADELTFDEGDTLYILDQTDSGWWRAKCGDKTGLIPYNYVEENTQSVDHPLHEAARRGNITFLKECIQNRVSVNGLDKAGAIPLHWAAHGGHGECMRMLLAQPNCEINVQNKLGDTPLHSAAWRGHAAVANMLIEKGARMDIRNNESKYAHELAKDPETAAIFQRLRRSNVIANNDYGDEEDSD